MLDLPRAEVHVWVVGADDPGEAVRQVLARYVGEPPHALVIDREADGKPFLVHPSGIQFNLSHTRGSALVAVARRPVGVDIEARRPVRHADGVAARIMTAGELARYRRREGAARAEFLLWAWTRKEALAKASGRGLRTSLREVPCEPEDGGRWRVVDLDVPGAAAAVAAEGSDWAPILFDGARLLPGESDEEDP